jgi:transposase-like protein
MPVGYPVSAKTKETIIQKIRHEGMTVSDAAQTYKASPKSIYRWLREGVVDGDRNLILELNRLKKENEQLYKLLGRATAEIQNSKS